jgi:tRNA-specific 2-thiouridylase
VAVQVQLRYRSEPVAALLTPVACQESDRQAGRPYRCRLDFDADQFSITPGQAAVFYEQDKLLGGGLIHL